LAVNKKSWKEWTPLAPTLHEVCLARFHKHGHGTVGCPCLGRRCNSKTLSLPAPFDKVWAADWPMIHPSLDTASVGSVRHESSAFFLERAATYPQKARTAAAPVSLCLPIRRWQCNAQINTCNEQTTRTTTTTTTKSF
jgi:hypothetical protein